MHNWYKKLARKKNRKFFVCDPLPTNTIQEGGRHQNDSNSRFCQTSIYFPKQRRAKANILFTEPYRNALCLKKFKEFLGSTFPIIPRMAQK
tara:strand:- start:4700 stop:4972 length:273 start_codon:yes stop_codon:yes gene_type:complete